MPTADPDIGPERMGPEQILTDSTLRRLPIRNRDLANAIPLAPLATARDGKVSILGRDPRLTTLEIDGTGAGDLLGGVSAPDLALGARPLAVEALQRLEVQPAPYDVRYGSSSAGTVEAITRSGTNRFEGSASGYYTSRHLQRIGWLGSRSGQRHRGRRRDHARGADRPRPAPHTSCRRASQHYVVPTDVRVIGSDTVGGADSAGVGFTQASARRLRQILLDRYGFDPGTADRFPLALPAANLFAKITWQPRVNSRLELSHAYDGSTVDFLSDFCRQAYTRSTVSPAPTSCFRSGPMRPAWPGRRRWAPGPRTSWSWPGGGTPSAVPRPTFQPCTSTRMPECCRRGRTSSAEATGMCSTSSS